MLARLFSREMACDLNHLDKNQMRKIGYEIEDLNTFCETSQVEVFRDRELFEECGVYAYLDASDVYEDENMFLTNINVNFKFAGICKESKKNKFFLKDKHVNKDNFFILLGIIKGVLFEKAWTDKTITRIIKNEKIVELDALINNPLTIDKIYDPSLIKPVITIYTDNVDLKNVLNVLIANNTMNIGVDPLDNGPDNRMQLKTKVQTQDDNNKSKICVDANSNGVHIDNVSNAIEKQKNNFIVVVEVNSNIVGLTVGVFDNTRFEIDSITISPIIYIDIFCGVANYGLVGRNMMNIFKQIVAQKFLYDGHDIPSNVSTNLSPNYCIFLQSLQHVNTQKFYINSGFIKLNKLSRDYIKDYLIIHDYLIQYAWFLTLNIKYIKYLTSTSHVSGISAKQPTQSTPVMSNTLTIIPQRYAQPGTPLGIDRTSNQLIRKNSITRLSEFQNSKIDSAIDKSLIEAAKETRDALRAGKIPRKSKKNGKSKKLSAKRSNRKKKTRR